MSLLLKTFYFRQCLFGIKISRVSSVTDIPQLDEDYPCPPSTSLNQMSHPY